MPMKPHRIYKSNKQRTVTWPLTKWSSGILSIKKILNSANPSVYSTSRRSWDSHNVDPSNIEEYEFKFLTNFTLHRHSRLISVSNEALGFFPSRKYWIRSVRVSSKCWAFREQLGKYAYGNHIELGRWKKEQLIKAKWMESHKHRQTYYLCKKQRLGKERQSRLDNTTVQEHAIKLWTKQIKGSIRGGWIKQSKRNINLK